MPAGYDRVNVTVSGGVWPWELSANDLAQFSVSEIRGLTPAQLAALTPVQLGGITAAQLSAMSVEQLAALSWFQVRAMKVARSSAVLSAAQLAALNKPFNGESLNAVTVSVGVAAGGGDVGFVDLTKASQGVRTGACMGHLG